MKNIVTCCFVLAFYLLPCRSIAQEWVRMMNDNNVNVHDVQKAFNLWYSTHPQEEGSIRPGSKSEDGNIENYRRWERMMVPRSEPTGVRPDPRLVSAEQLKVFNSRKNRKLDNALAGAAWTYIGLPTDTTSIAGNGRVNRLTFYPGNNNIIYACTPAGGLWKTINGGISWSTNTDLLPVLATSDLVIDPINPSIMYLATGDADAYDGASIGVLKSTDGGNTWDTTGLYHTLQVSGPAYLKNGRLLISPLRDSSIYCGTNLGLAYSVNAGLTWNNLFNGDVRDMAFEPGHPTTMYASTYDGKFYRSTDGLNFTQIMAGLPTAGLAGRMAISVSPADSNIVYVVAVNPTEASFYGLYRSADRGQTFTLQSNSPNLFGWSQTGSDSTGQGWYDLCIAVSPTNTDSVYVAGPCIWFSSDRGVHWTNISYNKIHVDNHHLIFAPGSSSMIYIAEDGGVYDTPDQGITFNDISTNLAIGEEYSIGLSGDNPDYFLTGWQDNGVNLDNNTHWSWTTGGDGLECFIDYTNDQNLYAASYLGGYSQSQDGGSSWAPINAGITESMNGTGPFLEDPIWPQVLFAGIKNVWEFGGSSWTQLSTWGTNYITAMAVATTNDHCFYVAEESSSYAVILHKTTDEGATWTTVTGNLPTLLAPISGIAIDPTNAQRVWVSYSGYSDTTKVFVSLNGGTTWQNISAGLPNLPVNCIVYQAGSPDGIYVGTDVGVYYRDSVVGHWMDYNAGLPHVKVDDIKIYAPENLVYAATYGRGTWKSATYVPAGIKEIKAQTSLRIYPNPTNGMTILALNTTQAGTYTLNVTNLLGQNLYEQKMIVAGNFSETLDLKGYDPGIYLVSVKGNTTNTVTKVIVY